MKYIGVILLVWFATNRSGQDIYICKNAVVTLYSKAPIEDIDARSDRGTSVLNTATGDVAFSVPIGSFKFDNALMQEHFNENYMESDKYPQASFKGRLTSKPDLSKDGSYPITAAGIFEAHGVKKSCTIPGVITITNGVVSLSSEFMVACKDHKIDIPKLVFQNIAETIKIKVTAAYAPYK
ncbi:YceI family protein [Mucilaginibacter sp. RB4R14]|uniref:YceI family protein n=1 Tax=Mucilaginibacter aurantiaciroseus TaxID=2949308 RepID=UPI0020917EB7|nr:YceI family protein [Mucilaginibacter aurantiaciroseus]MCO5935812.1 YceI family protein [Mucilaginibacter aurantiaciroseus]